MTVRHDKRVLGVMVHIRARNARVKTREAQSGDLIPGTGPNSRTLQRHSSVGLGRLQIIYPNHHTVDFSQHVNRAPPALPSDASGKSLGILEGGVWWQTAGPAMPLLLFQACTRCATKLKPADRWSLDRRRNVEVGTVRTLRQRVLYPSPSPISNYLVDLFWYTVVLGSSVRSLDSHLAASYTCRRAS